MESETMYPRLRSYYQRVAPLFEEPKVAAYTMLVLSFFAISIFGAFAIRPTIATIVELNKKLSDQKSVYQRMQEKEAQLRAAQVAYANVQPDLEAILKALPTSPQPALLLGKLNRSLVDNKINVVVLEFSAIPISKTSSQLAPIGFSLTGRASYNNILALIDLITRMDRIMSIDSVDISKGVSPEGILSGDLTVIIKGKSYVMADEVPAKKVAPLGGGNG